ncbi:MAG: phosphoribosyltransferase family protein [Ferruginibacter sp.]
MILNKETAAKKLHRLAMEIAEQHHNKTELILIGIKENGIFIAQSIAGYLAKDYKGVVKVISLAINKKQPAEILLGEQIDLAGKCIILIDDVANSGRTMLYALKPLLEQYPAQIQTLALLERTHKLFPVAVDYVGLSVATGIEETIVVHVEDGEVAGAGFK